jgi:transcription factor TFIIIB component B''
MEGDRIVLDEQSLTVATGPEALAIPADADMVVDGARHVSSSSYVQRAPADKWSDADTERFYAGLAQWGTDFTMLSRLFANRSRRQIKNKYKREERVYPQRIDAALSAPRQPAGPCLPARLHP